jgi:hypothetical protein
VAAVSSQPSTRPVPFSQPIAIVRHPAMAHLLLGLCQQLQSVTDCHLVVVGCERRGRGSGGHRAAPGQSYLEGRQPRRLQLQLQCFGCRALGALGHLNLSQPGKHVRDKRSQQKFAVCIPCHHPRHPSALPPSAAWPTSSEDEKKTPQTLSSQKRLARPRNKKFWTWGVAEKFLRTKCDWTGVDRCGKKMSEVRPK